MFSLLVSAGIAFGQGAGTAIPDVSVNIPGSQPESKGVPGIIANIYQFSLMIAVLLAFAMIVFAGAKYMFARGNPSAQSDARDHITQALLGLLLLAGAFIILNTVNPRLTKLFLPTLEHIQAPEPLSNINPGGVPGPGTPGPNSLTDQQARDQFRAAQIPIKVGVLLEGVQQIVVDEIIALKRACTNCDVTVTSATDSLHEIGACSHASGNKIDLRLDPATLRGLDRYIATNFTSRGLRSDGAIQYQNPRSGAMYAQESDHWDVVVGCGAGVLGSFRGGGGGSGGGGATGSF